MLFLRVALRDTTCTLPNLQLSHLHINFKGGEKSHTTRLHAAHLFFDLSFFTIWPLTLWSGSADSIIYHKSLLSHYYYIYKQKTKHYPDYICFVVVTRSWSCAIGVLIYRGCWAHFFACWALDLRFWTLNLVLPLELTSVTRTWTFKKKLKI